MGLFRGHTTTTRANKISEFTVATAEYGAAVPEIIGTTRVSGNVIYYDDFTAHEHRETQRTGKGGHSKSVSITYTYTVAVILGLCEGEISGLGRVWVGKDQYMYPNDAIQMTLFKGQANQQPWAYVSGKHPDKALPYTGLAYMAGVIDLGDSGSMPNYNFEVRGKLLSSGDGVDANPADYIRYVLDKVGLSKTEIIGLDNYRSYCKHADLLISTPMDQTSAKTARDIINEIATLTNAYMFWSNDKFKIVCCDDRAYPSKNPEDPDDKGWQPNRTIIYDLTADDFIPQTGGALVTYSRKDSSEIYNQFPVEFVNRDSGYEKETVSYALTQDIADYGLRQANTTSANYIYTKARAVKVAETLARKAQYERNKYTFKLDWAFCRLEVGDLVTLTDESCGLNKQPAMIDSVTEGTDGLLTITAISRAKGDYSAASFDVHAVDRPYVDYNVAPPDTDAPIILQPPAELTTSGLEVWIGARGESDGWGGCRVYVSDNKDYYRYAGQIATAARIGTLASTVTADATSIEIDANGDFLSGTQQDAERGNTLCWLGGECLSYQTATLLQNGHYELAGCIRGQYQTTATEHDAGAEFARLDTALLRIPFLKEDIGKKVYLKLASYNIFGNNEQDLSNLDEYEYTILPYYIPPVRNLKAHNRYRQLVDGVSRYDLEVEWEPPEDMTSYLEGQVWYKTDHEQGDRLVIKEGVPADELGYQHDWTFAGSGQNRATIPQAIVGDTYRIAVTTKDRWGATTSPDQAPRIEILVAVKSEIPNTPEGFGITFGNRVELYWDEVTNSDIAYYEVRTDQSTGLGTASLVVRTSSLKASVTLAERTGTLYLYACNAQGKYSYPAVLTYNKPMPDAPTNIAITTALRGANFRVPPIPSTATSVRYYISGTKTTDMIESKNPLVVYQCEPDVYSIYACYVDIFGEGYRTVDYAFTVTPYIDPKCIEDESISLKMVDSTIKTAVSDAQQAIPRLDKVDSDIASINDDMSTTKADLDNDIANINNKLNLSPSDENGYKSIQELNKKDGQLESIIATNKSTQDGVNQEHASLISQNDSAIKSVVLNLNTTDPSKSAYKSISQLSQTADEIKTTVQTNKTNSDNAISQVSQKADNVKVTIENKLNTTDPSKSAYRSISQLQANINGVTSTVQNNKSATDTQISQIKQNANSLSSTVQTYHSDTNNKISGLSSQISQNTDKITSIVTNLNDKDKASAAYSAIAQMIDAIQLRVTADNLKEMGQSGQLMSYINLTPTTVSILSKLLHITADTLIDGNVITNGMIKAGAITADKLAASIIELTANQGIKGGGATLDINGLTVRGNDGSYVVHGSNGMEFHDGNGNTFAMVGAMVMGTVKDGQWIKFTKPWKNAPNVIITPISLQTAIPGYNSTNLYLDCRAQNITTNGFQAVCRTVLKAGSGGNIPANATLISISYNGPTTSMSYGAPGGNKDCGSGFKSPDYNTIERYDTHTVSIPTDATECNFIVSADISASGWYGSYTYDTSLHISVQILKGSVSIYGPVEICSASTNNPDNVHEYTTYGSSTKTINCKASGDITVKIRTWFDMRTGSNGEYQKASKGNIKVVLSSYSFNTTADVPLASGNAFFLCTDQHNSPYTISDS
ncbi:phage tail protein [Mitsuokella multacida]|uniref:phage tail protein n=1 Tax=Mitsuokella multacida TaxID=52226 RepID=UPI00265F1FC0|nr:phage tail protein [Mitsuokella multacida]